MSDPRKSWDRVRDNADPLNWVILGFDDAKKIAVLSEGTGGRQELYDKLGDYSDKVLFAGLRVHAVDERGSVTSTRAKFIMVQYVGSNVGAMARGAVGQRRAEFEGILKGCHVTIQTSDVSDLEEKLLVAKLNESTGAHKPSGYDFNPQPDGSAPSGNITPADTKSIPAPEKSSASVQSPAKTTTTASPASPTPAPAAAAAPAAPAAPAAQAAAPVAGWKDVDVSNTDDFDVDGLYRAQISGSEGFWYPVNASSSKLVFTVEDDGKLVFGDLAASGKSSLAVRGGDATRNVEKLQKRA